MSGRLETPQLVQRRRDSHRRKILKEGEDIKVKRHFVKIIATTLSLLSVVTALTLGFVFAGNAQNGSQGGQRIVGTWNVHVSVRACQTGVEIRTFKSMEHFNQGGTMQDVSSGFAPSRQTPGIGVWSYLGGNIYSFRFKSFGFDANGNFTGWTIVRHEITLDANADEFTSEGTAEFYDANGNLLFTGCSSNTATRFE
jgi:hypothetical protein